MTVFVNQATLTAVALFFFFLLYRDCNIVRIISQQLSCQELSAGAGVRRRQPVDGRRRPTQAPLRRRHRRRRRRCRRWWWYQLDYTVIKMIFRATARNNVFSVSSLLATATVALCAKTKDTAAGCVTSVTTLEQ